LNTCPLVGFFSLETYIHKTTASANDKILIPQFPWLNLPTGYDLQFQKDTWLFVF